MDLEEYVEPEIEVATEGTGGELLSRTLSLKA